MPKTKLHHTLPNSYVEEVADYVNNVILDRFHAKGLKERGVIVVIEVDYKGWTVYADDQDTLEEAIEFVDEIIQDKIHDMEYERTHNPDIDFGG
jgi:hypothetical protein